jgi:hypothetical protein
MALPPVYKIHPAIGFARLGNAAADDLFVGPETPGRPPEPSGGRFKDSGGRVRPQAARFRIWEYTDNGKGRYEPKREINTDIKGAKIEWVVHLANKKAAFFTFDGLLGDHVHGPKGIKPVRRNAGVLDRKKLWLDPGFRKIEGRNKKGVEFRKGALAGALEFWPDPAPAPAIDYLGELRTDDKGRLLVIGGKGSSSKIPAAAAIGDYANNDGWFDDVSDGPVTATITFQGVAKPIKAIGAWVICTPPDFAPFAQNVVTLYDLLFDMAARELDLPTNDTQYDGILSSLRAINKEMKLGGRTSLSAHKPSFDQEIWPILEHALDATWLFNPAQHAHTTLGSGALSTVWSFLADPAANPAVRQSIFARLHPPGLAGAGGAKNMPLLLGDDPYDKWKVKTRFRLTLTPTQYALLEQWSKGNFVKGSAAPPGLPAALATPLPHQLDKAALENCVGGAFFPGIEVGWQIRHKDLFMEPFRINHRAPTRYISDTGAISPGHFTRQMALPWQADFLQCKQEKHGGIDWGWWPAQRPDQVYAKQADAGAKAPMVAWHRATTGGTPANWATGFSGDTKTPSYDEIIANWSKLAFIHEAGGVQFEDERPKDVP